MTLLYYLKPKVFRKPHGKPQQIEDFHESRQKLRDASREIVQEEKEAVLLKAESAIELAGQLTPSDPLSEDLTAEMLSYMDTLRSFNQAKYLQDKTEELILKQEMIAKAKRILEMQEEEDFVLMLLLH